MKSYNFLLIITIIVTCATYINAAPSDKQVTLSNAAIHDVDSHINANKLLMFVQNRGGFGRDLSHLYGKDDGLYYPYTSVADMEAGVNWRTLIFAAGLWIGAVDHSTGDTLFSGAEYDYDFASGPMINGSADPTWETNESYRVYSLYADSMETNPNQDYIEWPIADGAPVDSNGFPRLYGDQTTWTVFNDMPDPSLRNSGMGSYEGMGLEIHQTIWAEDEDGPDPVAIVDKLTATHQGTSRIQVEIWIDDISQLTGHDYEIVIDTLPTLGNVWHVIDITFGDTVLANQTSFRNDNLTVTDGFLVLVSDPGVFTSFSVVANGAGVLPSPVSAALTFQGFPTPGNQNPGSEQQVGDGLWAIHTGDNGGTCDGGNRGSFDSFIARVTRSGYVSGNIGRYDYEIRFTADTNSAGLYDSSLGGGSIGIEAYIVPETPIWVPFELWRTGIGTPDDPSDDVRLVPWILEHGDNDTFDLESYGCAQNVDHGGFGEHSASGNDDDPFSDWIYFRLPLDDSPGETGYNASVAQILNSTYNFDDIQLFARIVFINWNGGETKPFTQSLPEPGTVFRIEMSHEVPLDLFSFNTTPPPNITTGPKGLTINIAYKFYNKGLKTLDSIYLGIWSDIDLGDAGDDLVGCDSLDDLFYCYNDGPDDDYGLAPPAVGFKFLYGPLVPASAQVGYFDGQYLSGYRNLGIAAFDKFFQGQAPYDPQGAYCTMQGKNYGCQLYDYNGQVLRYWFSGDPVTGLGDIDSNPSDRVMLGSTGPFTMLPGDSQYVFIRLAVGQGTDPLSSITKLREYLNQPKPVGESCCSNRGDINHSGGNPAVDISDLTYFVDYMFRQGAAPPCLSEADLDLSNKINIIDLVLLVDFIYREGPLPTPCE